MPDINADTPQQIFNYVYTTLVRRGLPAVTGIGCAYRSSVGPCAAGLYIPDDRYTPELEGEGLEASNERQIAAVFGTVVLSEEQEYKRRLLQLLQMAHDQSANGRGWLVNFKIRAAEVAASYNLTVPEIVYK